MKNEREEAKGPSEERLTTSANSSNLREEGIIFMDENHSEVQPAPIEPSKNLGPEVKPTLEPQPAPISLEPAPISQESKQKKPLLASGLTSMIERYRSHGFEMDGAPKQITKLLKEKLLLSGYEEKEIEHYNDHMEELMQDLEKRVTDEESERVERVAAYKREHPAKLSEEDERRYEEIARDRAALLELSLKEELARRLEGITDPKDIKEITDHFNETEAEPRRKKVKQFDEEIHETRGFSGIPQSLEDLVVLISTKETERWKENGADALYSKDKKTKEIIINKENFLKWVRTRMLSVHDFNSMSRVDFFGDEGMGVKTDYRTISFYEIVFTRSFWLETKSEGGKVTRHKDDDYEALKNQVTYEVFLFGLMRNGALDYELNRFSGELATKTLSQIYTANPLTRSNFMELIFSMPSMKDLSIGDKTKARRPGKEMKTKVDTNFYMGEAIRRALAAYMNIVDYKQLEAILGPDAALFQAEYRDFEHGYDTEESEETQPGKMKRITPNPDPNPDPTGKIINRENWFDASTRRIKDVPQSLIEKARKHPESLTDQEKELLKNRADYLAYINIFTGPGPSMEQDRITEIRERMVLSIMQKTGISYVEAKIAEAWAFSMTGFTGVAARNDNAAIGFDVWTKLSRLKEYRLRQREEKRRGKFGNEYNIYGIKRLVLTFFEGARDIYKRPIFEIIQGGQGRHIDIDNNPVKNWVSEHKYKKDAQGNIDYGPDGKPIETQELAENGVDIAPVKKPWKFNANLQRQFVPNHFDCGVKVQEFILNNVQFKFQEMVKGYIRGKPIIDYEKLDEIREGISHDIRYVLSTWPEIDFGARIVTSEKLSDGEKRLGIEPVREMSTLESMFDNEVLWFIQQEAKRRFLVPKYKSIKEKEITVAGLDEPIIVETEPETGEGGHRGGADFRDAVWKGVFHYLVAKEIAAHRDIGNTNTWFDLMDMKKIYDVLYYGQVSGKSEIKDVQKNTNTGMRHVFARDARFALANAGMSGLLAMIVKFMQTM